MYCNRWCNTLMLFDRATLMRIARLLGIGQKSTYEPTQVLVDAAARDIPAILRELETYPYTARTATVPAGEKVIPAEELIRQLTRRGHVRGASAWGVYRLLERGLLDGEVTQIRIPDDRFTERVFANVGRTVFSLGDSRSSIQVLEFSDLVQAQAVVTVGLPPDRK